MIDYRADLPYSIDAEAVVRGPVLFNPAAIHNLVIVGKLPSRMWTPVRPTASAAQGKHTGGHFVMRPRQKKSLAFPKTRREEVPEDWRTYLYEQAGKACHYCRRKLEYVDITMDHVIPVSRGGKTVLSNLVCACRMCNLQKRGYTVEEWRRTWMWDRIEIGRRMEKARLAKRGKK